jgi:hypothetical protein
MESSTSQPGFFIQILPLLLVSVIFALITYFLAKKKGRNLAVWTIVGAIPFVNTYAVVALICLPTLRLERKVDQP